MFTSWGVETARKFTKAEVEHALTELDTGNYGMILRSKGIVNGGADGWLEFVGLEGGPPIFRPGFTCLAVLWKSLIFFTFLS